MSCCCPHYCKCPVVVGIHITTCLVALGVHITTDDHTSRADPRKVAALEHGPKHVHKQGKRHRANGNCANHSVTDVAIIYSGDDDQSQKTSDTGSSPTTLSSSINTVDTLNWKVTKHIENQINSIDTITAMESTSSEPLAKLSVNSGPELSDSGKKKSTIVDLGTSSTDVFKADTLTSTSKKRFRSINQTMKMTSVTDLVHSTHSSSDLNRRLKTKTSLTGSSKAIAISPTVRRTLHSDPTTSVTDTGFTPAVNMLSNSPPTTHTKMLTVTPPVHCVTASVSSTEGGWGKLDAVHCRCILLLPTTHQFLPGVYNTSVSAITQCNIYLTSNSL